MLLTLIFPLYLSAAKRRRDLRRLDGLHHPMICSDGEAQFLRKYKHYQLNVRLKYNPTHPMSRIITHTGFSIR